MSKEKKNDLPSINDFTDYSLPSVEDFIENSSDDIKEEIQIVEDSDKDISSPWPELLRLISDVRNDIPKIPEIKYYDEELEHLEKTINEIKEKSYDVEIEAICEQIDIVKNYVSTSLENIPEIKYYDEELEHLEKTISEIKQSFLEIPEIRYYEEDIKNLHSTLEEVKNSIPNVPHWVQETYDVPDFSWYVDVKKTFNTIGENIGEVQDSIEKVNLKFEDELKKFYDEKEVLIFETEVGRKNLEKEFVKSKHEIWEELKRTSLRIWEQSHLYKDDDRKLKKQINSQYNQLKQNIENKLEEVNKNSIKTDELLLNHFKNLQDEFNNFPEVKYYEEDIDNVKSDINDVKSDINYVKSDFEKIKKIIEDIKSTQKQLREEQELLSEESSSLKEDIADTNNSDPLTPLNQKFVTLDELQNHYKLFIARIQQQISTIGGGGETRLQYLDDIAGITTNISAFEGMSLIVDTNQTGKNKHKKFKFVSVGSTWASTSSGIHTTKNVGIATTARSDFALYVEGDQYIDGNITVGGTVTYEDVKNVDSLGIVTARTGINVLAKGINVIGVSTISTGVGTVHVGVGSTALLVEGDARVTGILTIGQGSITLDPTAKKIEGIDEIIIGTGTTVRIHQDASGEVAFSDREGKQASVGIGTTVNINTTGIITAASFGGSGISLTGIVTSIVAGDNITISGSTGRITINSSGGDAAGAGGTWSNYDSNAGVTTTKKVKIQNNLEVTGVTTSTGGFVGNLTGNASGSSGSCTGNSATATALQTARDIGGVSFDGTGSINLPGVNQSGNQDTSGNAATATILETARDIGGVSFNGSASINLPGVNQAGNQNTSGTAAGLSGTPDIAITNLTGVGATFTGITTAQAFAGYNYLQAPFSTTVEFAVTIASKTAAHRYNGTGSSNAYVINGVQSPFLTLTPGRTYRFTLSSSDMTAHPFRFYLEADKTTAYTTNVTSTSTYTEIVVTDNTPQVLHYQCSNHGYMGNAVNTNSSAVVPSQTAIFRGGLVEKFESAGTTLGAQTNNPLTDGNVILFTGNESGNLTVNFTGVHSTLSSGETVSFTTILTPNGSGVINTVQVDGEAGITTYWSGGSAPSAGSSGQDIYTFQILKTGSGTSDYTVYGAATNYA